jgi:hypothetical protein
MQKRSRNLDSDKLEEKIRKKTISDSNSIRCNLGYGKTKNPNFFWLFLDRIENKDEVQG